MTTRCAACNHVAQIVILTHWAPLGRATPIDFELCPLCVERLAQADRYGTRVEKRLLKLVELRLLLNRA
jgi:uncharacterized protein YlaI